MTTENIYQTPEAPLLSQDDPTQALLFFTTHRRKMIILSVCTLNMYSVYWFYKHWSAQRLNGGRDCLPALRAIFQVFFVFSLFSTIKYDAELKKLIVTWSAGWLAAFYILCTIVGSIIERFGDNTQNLSSYSLISLVCYLLPIIPLVLVQQTANVLNGDPKGLKNATLSWQNWIFIILGILWWLLVMVGLFLPSA